MPHDNKIYINILILAVFLAVIIIPVLYFMRREGEMLVVVEDVSMTEESTDSVYEFFNGGNFGEDLGQYFIDDPFREGCSAADGAVSSHTVCVR
jgi:hypothetical protein